MSHAYDRFLGAVVVAMLASLTPALSQMISVGFGELDDGSVNPVGTETIVDTFAAANFDGQLTTAVFGWSASPCPAAAKLKIFRPSSSLVFFHYPLPTSFAFVAERGPFDVTAPLMNSQSPYQPYATQTVALNPPLDVLAGDLIGITNLTACGGPTYQRRVPFELGPPPGGSFTVSGDVTSTVSNPQSFNTWVFVLASGMSPEFGMLQGRFVTSLVATDPRTGRTAQGVPNPLNYAAGFFSLPDFTGDPTFPEVMVKMVDASHVPELGGDFWFFHAPLTDVQYTLTVKDLITGAIRTYSNTSGSPAQFCGGVDTSAFPGP